MEKRLVMVCGSRKWPDVDAVRRVLAERIHDPASTVVMQGGASGADKMAAIVARQMGCDVETVPADWNRYGRGAGPKRNAEMIGRRPDLVIAFWDGKSRGTLDAISKARQAG